MIDNKTINCIQCVTVCGAAIVKVVVLTSIVKSLNIAGMENDIGKRYWKAILPYKTPSLTFKMAWIFRQVQIICWCCWILRPELRLTFQRPKRAALKRVQNNVLYRCKMKQTLKVQSERRKPLNSTAALVWTAWIYAAIWLLVLTTKMQ